MLGNCQLSDWTQFGFDEARLHEAEARFLKCAGVVAGSMHHLDGEPVKGRRAEGSGQSGREQNCAIILGTMQNMDDDHFLYLDPREDQIVTMPPTPHARRFIALTSGKRWGRSPRPRHCSRNARRKLIGRAGLFRAI